MWWENNPAKIHIASIIPYHNVEKWKNKWKNGKKNIVALSNCPFMDLFLNFMVVSWIAFFCHCTYNAVICGD